MNQSPSIFALPSRQVASAVTDSLGVTQHPRVSIEGNRFSLIDAAGVAFPWPQLHLDVIIVNANPATSKQYYEAAYSPNEGVPPTCFSDNGIAPSTTSSRKMCWELAGQTTCNACPLNSWGSEISAMTGKGIKACRDKKKLAVLVIGDTTRLIYELQIPPNSLGNINVYSQKLTQATTPDGSRPADLPDVVTRVTFEQGLQGTLEFQEIAWIYSVGADQQLYVDQAGHPGMAPDGGQATVQRLIEDFNNQYSDTIIGVNDTAWQPAPGQQFIPQQHAPQLPGGAPQGAIAGAPIRPAPGPQMTHQQPAPAALQQPQSNMGPAQYQSQPQQRVQQPFGAAVPQGPQGQPQPVAPQPTAPKAARGGSRAGAGRKARGAATPQQQLPAGTMTVMPPGQGQTVAYPQQPQQGQPQQSYQPAPQQQGQPQQGSDMPSIPGFLLRPQGGAPGAMQQPAQPQQPAQQGHPGQPAFGFVQQPGAPSGELDSAIETAFSLTKPQR